MSPFNTPFHIKSIDHGFILSPSPSGDHASTSAETGSGDGTPVVFTYKEDHLECNGLILTRELSNMHVGFIRMLFLPRHLHSGGDLEFEEVGVGDGGVVRYKIKYDKDSYFALKDDRLYSCFGLDFFLDFYENVPSAVFEIVPVKAVKDEEDVKDVKVEKCESEDETEIKAEVKDETKDEIKEKIKEEDRE